MNIKDFYPIGRITRPHGLKGEVTLVLTPEAPHDPESLRAVYIDRNGSLVPYFVDAISIKGAKAYVRFQDVDTHERAVAVSGFEIFLPKAERPSPGEFEFYSDEVTGFTVRDAGRQLGTVAEVIRSGLQRLLVVRQQEKEILIPINGPFIRKVDRGQRTILVDLPEGFLEI